MRFLLAVTVLILSLTACSTSGDEDAFYDAAFAKATTNELMEHNSAEFLTAGQIVCGMIKNGEARPGGVQATTGIRWSTVWDAAATHLCP